MVTGRLVVNNTRLNVPDYVFGKGYALNPLPDVGRFIAEHGHLPGVPTARDVTTQGLDLAQMQMVHLEKIEELTLHSIGQHKTITTQGARIERLEELIEDMRATRCPISFHGRVSTKRLALPAYSQL